MVNQNILDIEEFYIHNYDNDGKYILPNRQITNHFDVYINYDHFTEKKWVKSIWTYQRNSLLCMCLIPPPTKNIFF